MNNPVFEGSAVRTLPYRNDQSIALPTANDAVAPATESHDVLTVCPSRLYGDVRLSGAKNSALRLLAASILTPGEIQLTNYPASILDAELHVEMLEALGKECHVTGDQIVISETKQLKSELVWNKRSIRNSLLILGALVARTGHGSVPLPGGCDIGSSGGRAFDLHVLVLEKLGAKVTSPNGTLQAEAPHGLVGADIKLPIRSTGATENAILAASLAKGRTRIWNPHIRPEILDLIALLNKMGAKITAFGQERIEIEGQPELGSAHHNVIPDNVEALTWLIAAVVTGGEIEILDFPFAHLELPLIFLRESGARLFRSETSLVVRGGSCYPLELSTGPYPGINSDMQPLLAVYGSQARGQSKLIDLRFPGRYRYAEELGRMGLDYQIDGNVLQITGGARLQGAAVTAIDLRAGAALALAGLVADGPTHIHDAWQISRGYSSFAEKAQAMGARVYWAAENVRGKLAA